MLTAVERIQPRGGVDDIRACTSATTVPIRDTQASTSGKCMVCRVRLKIVYVLVNHDCKSCIRLASGRLSPQLLELRFSKVSLSGAKTEPLAVGQPYMELVIILIRFPLSRSTHPDKSAAISATDRKTVRSAQSGQKNVVVQMDCN